MLRLWLLLLVLTSVLLVASAAIKPESSSSEARTTSKTWDPYAGLGSIQDWRENAWAEDVCERNLPQRRGNWLEPVVVNPFPGRNVEDACSGFAYGMVGLYGVMRDVLPVDDRVCSQGSVLNAIQQRYHAIFKDDQSTDMRVLWDKAKVKRVDRLELLTTDILGRIRPDLAGSSAGALYFVTLQETHGVLKEARFILLVRDSKTYLYAHLQTSLPSIKETIHDNNNGLLNDPDEEGNVTTQSSTNLHSSVKVLSYNVWNTMPHRGGEWNYTARDDRYRRRLDLLRNVIVQADADIVLLQEVRFDTTFGIQHDPSQFEHLLRGLPYQYFVHQPAMAFMDGGGNYEGDEGVSILSRFPIVNSSYKLLSRVIGKDEDFHQRVCLHARVEIAGSGLLDVFTSHFSLYSPSRQRGSRETVEFANEVREQQGDANRLVGQIFAGDVNDEPGSSAIAPLFTEGFRDVWREQYEEPPKGSKEPMHRAQAFTFPSDDPKKRIDLMLARGSRLQAMSVKLVGQDAEFYKPSQNESADRTIGTSSSGEKVTMSVHGQPPAEKKSLESKNRSSSRSSSSSSSSSSSIGSSNDNEKAQKEVTKAKPSQAPSRRVGMEHPDSQLWASDHRGVLTSFRILSPTEYCRVEPQGDVCLAS